MLWHTNTLLPLIQSLFPTATVRNDGQLGDYTSDKIHVELSKGGLDLVAFNPDSTQNNPSECQMPLLQLACHWGNGMEGAFPEEVLAYALLAAKLIELGWNVVPSMDGYF